MINNMDSLYGVIRKGGVILVEGDSKISRMIKLFTQSSWSHPAIYVGDALLKIGGIDKERVWPALKSIMTNCLPPIIRGYAADAN